jgi:hypothetical protein
VADRATQATYAAGIPIDRANARREMLTESRERNRARAEVDVFSYERGFTDDDIKAAWEANRVDGSNRGTEAHLQMELFMNSLPCRTADPEVVTGLKFVREQLAPLGVTAYRTEWEIFAEPEGIAGSIDFVGRLPSGKLVIVDWKRCKHLDGDVVSKYNKKMRAPLQMMHDSSGCRYTLQLSVYAYILQRYYGEEVDGLALCSLHPEHAFHTWCPYLKEAAEYLMFTCRARQAALERAELEADESVHFCALEGRIVHDGVKADGRVYNRKPFQVAHPGAAFTEAVAETASTSAILARIETPPSQHDAALARCRPWGERMTARGHPNFKSCHEF